MDGDTDVTQYVAETAARLQDRLAQLSSGMKLTMEKQIPELGGDRRAMELLGPCRVNVAHVADCRRRSDR